MALFENFPWTNFHELNLDWILETIKELSSEWLTEKQDLEALKTYITEYFENLDVSEEVNEVVNTYVESQEFAQLVANVCADMVYPSPGFASSTAGMTDHKMLYVNTGNSNHIYKWNGTAWQDTGVVYAANAPDNIFVGRLANGSVSITVPSQPQHYREFLFTFDADARLVTRSGRIVDIANATYDLDIEQSQKNFEYLVYDTAVSGFTRISHSNVNELLQTKYVIICGIYQYRLMEFEILLNGLTTTYRIPSDITYNEWHPIRGMMYLWVVGNNWFYMVDENFRYSYGGTAQSLPTGRQVIIGENTVQQALVWRQGVLAAVNARDVRDSDTLVATAFNEYIIRNCFPDNIVANYPPVHMIVPLKVKYGYPWKLDNSRLGYKLYPTFAQGSNALKKGNDFVMIEDAQTYSLYTSTADKNIPEPGGHSFTITLNNESIASKKIMFIGDSIANRGWLQDRIHTAVPSVQFVGTEETGQGIGLTGYYCEAIPGLSTTEILSNGSNFWDPNSGRFNFTYYVNHNNIIPDIVVIEFGLNESLQGEAFRNNIQTIIDSIRTYSNSIKIYVMTPFRRRLAGHTNAYNTNAANYWRQQECMAAAYTLEHCTLIPTSACLTDWLDYVTLTEPYLDTDIQIEVNRDNIHPAQNTGFQILANTLLAYLGT